MKSILRAVATPALPLEIPVRGYPTPQVVDGILYEVVDRTKGDYRDIQPGTPHPNVRLFSGYVLVQQRAMEGTEKMVQRFWVNPRVNQNTYNDSGRFSAESNSHPIFIRTYLERRESYAARTKGSALTGVVAAKLTAAGSGYTDNTTATFTGGAGSGATAIPVIFRGAIYGVIITAEGTGYTSAPTVVFTDSTGTGAAATAILQPATAILVKEERDRMEGEPVDSIFVKVTRIYETLPGPWLPFTRYDDNLGPIQGRRRAVVNTGQAASLTATTKTTYEARDGSSYVSWEIEETNSGGTGGVGTGAFPIGYRGIHEDDRGPVQDVEQVIVRTGSEVGSLTLGGGIVTETEYLPVDDFHVKRVVETWSVPAEVRTSNEFDEFGGTLTTAKTLVDGTTTPTNITTNVQSLRAVSDIVGELESTTHSTGAIVDDIERSDPRVPGSRATAEYYLVSDASVIPSDTSTITYERQRYPKNANLRIEIKTTYAFPASYEEQDTQSFAFPRIFYNWFWYEEIGQFHDFRPGFSDNIPVRIAHEFGTTKQTVTPISIIEAEWRALAFSGSGLTDQNLIRHIINGNTYDYNLPASTPSKATYLGWIGTEKLIGGQSVIWRAGIYHTTRIYAVMK